ncbi:hypothetical protein GCM10009422_25850 [Brevundimonas kwangchunensis]|uniref:Uncharacterized protein n=1 Tax=Brevundimonas kwangchunensis TaxID=322163 RepID=A0ABP3S6J8_9CAUL
MGVVFGVRGCNLRVSDGEQAQIDLGLRDVPAAKREYAAEVFYGWQVRPGSSFVPTSMDSPSRRS